MKGQHRTELPSPSGAHSPLLWLGQLEIAADAPRTQSRLEVWRETHQVRRNNMERQKRLSASFGAKNGSGQKIQAVLTCGFMQFSLKSEKGTLPRPQKHCYCPRPGKNLCSWKQELHESIRRK